jgi:hypothetical protein
METMDADKSQDIRSEIAALRARSATLLAQSEALRERSELMAKRAADAEAEKRRQAAERA